MISRIPSVTKAYVRDIDVMIHSHAWWLCGVTSEKRWPFAVVISLWCVRSDVSAEVNGCKEEMCDCRGNVDCGRQRKDSGGHPAASICADHLVQRLLRPRNSTELDAACSLRHSSATAAQQPTPYSMTSSSCVKSAICRTLALRSQYFRVRWSNRKPVSLVWHWIGCVLCRQ